MMQFFNPPRSQKVKAMGLRAWIGVMIGVLIVLLGTNSVGAWPDARIGQESQDSLTIAIQADPVQLDPALAEDVTTWRITGQIFETLINYQPGSSLVEIGLAESWSVSPDGLIWTFNLRPEVKFHDGTSLDASAVAYNLNRWWDPAHPFHNGDFVWFTSFFGGYKGDPSSWLAGIATPTSSQVQLTLSAPHSNLPAILAHPAFVIASPVAIQAGTLATNPVGRGPFVFAEWEIGSHLRLEANLDYWGAVPGFESLIFQVIAQDDERFAALQAGAVQVVPDLPPEFAALAEADAHLVSAWRPSISTGYLGMNRSHAHLDNDLVRLAIAHAIDRSALLDSFYHPGTHLAQNLLPPIFWGSDLGVDEYEYNPDLSLDLLDESGYPDGFQTTLAIRDVVRPYLPNPVQTAQAIQADLLAVGIQADLVIYESSEFIDKFNNGELDLFLLGWTADYLHPENFFTPILCDGWLGFGPKDTVLCDTLDQARAKTEFAAQEALYQWSTRRVHATLPMLPVAHPRELLLTRQELNGVLPSPIGVESYNQAWIRNKVYLPLTTRE